MAAVLITGSSGLIGRHCLAAWPPSTETVLVDRQVHDLLAPGVFGELIRQVKPAVVVHLAWSASSTPGYRSSPANHAWHAVSLEAARTCLSLGSRFIGTGTVADDRRDGDAYVAAKSALRSALDRPIGTGAVTWLRPHYVFDPDEPSPAVLRAAAAARKSHTAVQLSTPDAAHDFVHAGDVGRAVVATVLHHLSGVVDVGSGRLRTVKSLVESGGTTWTRSPTRAKQPRGERCADIAPLRATGWSPLETEGFFAHG